MTTILPANVCWRWTTLGPGLGRQVQSWKSSWVHGVRSPQEVLAPQTRHPRTSPAQHSPRLEVAQLCSHCLRLPFLDEGTDSVWSPPEGTQAGPQKTDSGWSPTSPERTDSGCPPEGKRLEGSIWEVSSTTRGRAWLEVHLFNEWTWTVPHILGARGAEEGSRGPRPGG